MTAQTIDTPADEVSAAETPTATPAIPMIYAAMARVMADVGPVGKGGTNKDQGYKFRSIEDVMNAARVALVRNHVFYLPTVLTRIPEERRTNNGKPMNVIHLEIRYDFYTVDGSSVAAVVWGEGADLSDKATNKSMSAALKYNLVQALNIAAADMADGDQTTVEAGPSNYQSAAAAFESASPAPRRQAAPVHVPPLADDDPWKTKIDDIASRDEATDVYAEVAEMRKAGTIDDARAARLGSLITARVANLGLAAQNGTAASTAAAAQDQPPARIRQEDQGAPAPATPARPADGAREAAEAEWVRGFMARLADVPSLDKVLPMQREIGQAVQARTITPETGGVMAKACRARANELETAAKAA